MANHSLSISKMIGDIRSHIDRVFLDPDTDIQLDDCLSEDDHFIIGDSPVFSAVLLVTIAEGFTKTIEKRFHSIKGHASISEELASSSIPEDFRKRLFTMTLANLYLSHSEKEHKLVADFAELKRTDRLSMLDGVFSIFVDKVIELDKASSKEKNKCPLDGNSVQEEPSIGYLICSECNEMLTPSELVTKANQNTQSVYLSHYYPNGYTGDLPVLADKENA